MTEKKAKRIVHIYKRIDYIKCTLEYEYQSLKVYEAIHSVKLQEKERNSIIASEKAINKYNKLIDKLSINRSYLLSEKLNLEIELQCNKSESKEIQIKSKLELIKEML